MRAEVWPTGARKVLHASLIAWTRSTRRFGIQSVIVAALVPVAGGAPKRRARAVAGKLCSVR
jgi:hypothetical protein